MLNVEVIEPQVFIYKEKSGQDILKSLELYGRVCYKSEDKITENSAENFIRKIIQSGHLSVIEHEKVTVKVICDRGVSHEIVRHRIGSYSQESTRYVNYAKKKMQVIKPCFWEKDSKEKWILWENVMDRAAAFYKELISLGATPQEARSILPNSLKTEIVITYNLREWRHFFELRCSNKAHPQMRQIAKMLLKEISDYIPVVFEDQLHFLKEGED